MAVSESPEQCIKPLIYPQSGTTAASGLTPAVETESAYVHMST